MAGIFGEFSVDSVSQEDKKHQKESSQICGKTRSKIRSRTTAHKKMTELIPNKFGSVIPPPKLPKIIPKTFR